MCLCFNAQNNSYALADATFGLFPRGWSRRLHSHHGGNTFQGFEVFSAWKFSEKVFVSVPPQR